MNFEEIKKNTEAFVKEELLPLEPWILNVKWEEKLTKLNELREKVGKDKREFEGFHIDSNLWRVFTVYAVHRLQKR